MSGGLRALSIYEGFFSGGARILHSGVVAGLHADGAQNHSVLSLHRAMWRETMRQRMEDDSSFRLLRAAGVPIKALSRTFDGKVEPRAFSDRELTMATSYVERADIVLSLKEQPLRLVNQIGTSRPVVACLHRSDPENQGSALAELTNAAARGHIAAAICCAESTRDAYQAAGIAGALLHVIPNGVDLARFRPVSDSMRAQIRRSLGVPAAAPVVVYAARYDAMKNVPLFLRSAVAYLRREKHAHVLMCGPGMRRSNIDLRQSIDSLGAEPSVLRRIHLLGLQTDMAAVYAAADVVTLTSSTGEAAPLALIEGMMCGAIPVATDVGDCAAIVAGHGLIASPTPDSLSTAWIEATARRREFARSLAASRPRFSHTRMIASYATLINRVGARHATATGPLGLGV